MSIKYPNKGVATEVRPDLQNSLMSKFSNLLKTWTDTDGGLRFDKRSFLAFVTPQWRALNVLSRKLHEKNPL